MTNLTLHTLDFPSLHRQTIGFDRLFSELNRTFANSRSDNYPPHNIAQVDDTNFLVEVAVAGFAESEIDVEVREKSLIITGQKEKVEDAATIKYLHKGLSARNFTRTFTLADHVEVRSATIENGVLTVALELVVPEEEKPTKIAITVKK
jgi:molecular chaperone IbpA